MAIVGVRAFVAIEPCGDIPPVIEAAEHALNDMVLAEDLPLVPPTPCLAHRRNRT